MAARVPRAPSEPAAAAAVLAVYALAVVWLTWPLAPLATTHLPDPKPVSFDTLYEAWVLAYQSHALTTDPARLLEANIYHPARHALLYGPSALGALPYFLPTFWITGNPALALNLTFLGCTALSAWSMHLVVRRWTGSHLGGFVAAWTLLTTNLLLWGYSSAVPRYAVLQYFPAIVLLAADVRPRRSAVFALLGLVVFQCLVDVVYVTSAVLVPLVILALARLIRRSTRTAGLRLLAVVALAVVALLPVYAGYRLVVADNPLLWQQSPWASPSAAFPFQGPTILPWGLLQVSPTALPLAAWLVIAAGALGLAAGAWRGEEPRMHEAWAHGAFWAVVGVVISLSPLVVWGSHVVRLPQAFLAQWVPIYRVIRMPVRLGLGSLVGLSLLAGVGFVECCRWLPGRGRPGILGLAPRVVLAGALATAMLVLGTLVTPWRRAVRPYRVMDAIVPDSPILRALREPGGPLLELPAGTRATFAVPLFNTRAMYRSIFHWRPLLNGYAAFWPAGFRERMELAVRLPDPTALAALRAETGLAMILVHTGSYADGRAHEWRAIAEKGRDDLALAVRDGDDLLFAVRPPASGP